MVETITPVVHGGSRTRWGISVAVHAIAATIVAGAFGAALGALGSALAAPWGSGAALLVTGAAAWAVAHELFAVPFPVPQLRRQVPDWWRSFFPPLVSAALYGAGLGVGFLTYLLHPTLVVVVLAALGSGRPLAGAAIVAPFGLARGLGAIAAAGGPDVVHSLAAFARRRAPLAALNAAALVSVALAAAASARGPVDVPGLAGATLAVVFAWSAAWKLVRARAWRSIVERYRLGVFAAAAATAVPAAEAFVVVLVAAGARRAAAVLALALVASFTVAAVRRRSIDPSPVPCGCFGTSETTVPRLLVRNAALGGAAALAVAGPDGVDVAAPAAGDAVPILLIVAGLAGAAVAARSVRRSLRGGRA
jgi:hypothetical protein